MIEPMYETIGPGESRRVMSSLEPGKTLDVHVGNSPSRLAITCENGVTIQVELQPGQVVRMISPDPPVRREDSEVSFTLAEEHVPRGPRLVESETSPAGCRPALGST